MSETLSERLKRLGKKARNTAYKGISKVESILDENKGTIDNVAGTVKTGVDAAKKGVNYVSETASDLKQRFDEAGGLEGIAQSVKEAIESGAENLGNKVETYLNNTLENTVFTDGVYDPEKAKAFGKNVADNAKVYGARATRAIKSVIDSGVQDYQAWKKGLFPNQEELLTRYAGIGTDYKGKEPLFRTDYERCRLFHEMSRKYFDAEFVDDETGKQAAQALLADIKASASASASEVLEYYQQQNISGEDATPVTSAKIALVESLYKIKVD